MHTWRLPFAKERHEADGECGRTLAKEIEVFGVPCIDDLISPKLYVYIKVRTSQRTQPVSIINTNGLLSFLVGITRDIKYPVSKCQLSRDTACGMYSNQWVLIS